jgi:F0F1-type ATP synthase assembly protein I
VTPAKSADRTSFDPLSAGALLTGVLFGCVGLGALLGWVAGSVGIGVLVGAVVGIPAAIGAVYRRYRDVF